MRIIGVIIIIAGNDIPLYVVGNYGLLREKIAFISQDLQATIILLFAIAIILTTRLAMGFNLALDGII